MDLGKCGAKPHMYTVMTRREDGAIKAARTAIRMQPYRDFLEQFERAIERNHGLVEIEVERPAAVPDREIDESQARLEGWCA